MTRKIPFMEGIMPITASLGFFITLIILYHGLSPTVFSDEWVYSSSARLLPLKESITPSYLYLLIYKHTNYCGSHFLTCARWLNAIFFSLALPFIYLVSCKVTSRYMAMWIASLALLGPINSYTAYFMPESIYFFAFWVLTWCVIRGETGRSFIYGMAIGFMLALMSLIKMHAIFLMPALIIFQIGVYLNGSAEIRFRQMVLTIFYMVITWVMVRFCLGYLLAGKAGLSLLGIKYQYNALSVFDIKRFIYYLKLIKVPLLGHLAALMIILGSPIVMMIRQIKNHKKEHRFLKTITMYALACLVTLLFIAAFTTAQMTGWGPYDALERIHMRYYNFIFPLFFMIAAAYIPSTSSFRQGSNLLIVMITGIAYGCLILYMKNHYLISFIDCPELFGLMYHPFVSKMILLLGLVCLVLSLIQINWGATLYVFGFLPLTLLFSSYFVVSELRQERLNHQDAYDRAGLFVHQYLGKGTSHLAVVGSELGGLYKVLFYLDDPKASITELSPGTPLEFAKIPKDKYWVLFIGDYPVLSKPAVKISMEDFTLIKFRQD